MKKKDSGTTSETQRASYIAAIGASAGGLEALQEFFKAVPLDSGIGFVVIQHLSPDYKSLMDELLARHTKLRIEKANDGMVVEADAIYLIPPRKNLSIFHGKLMLEDQGVRSGLILPIDIFFRSLASDLGKNAIGIILSGTGSDGTLGTRAIKEAGGMVMAQEEHTAKFDGMPRSTINTGLVDYILPPGKMPEELINYIKHPFVGQSKEVASALTGDIDSLTKVMMMLRDFSGIDFSYYKENTIIRRLERRLSINRFERLDDYIKFLSESDKEKDILYRELLIGVTRFFRDEAAFNIVKENLLPRMFDTEEKKQLRIWSAGCSTGEEVYSLALFIREYMDEHNISAEVKIFATDIDKRSLELAGTGFYPESIVSDVEPHLLAKYFTRHDNGYQVNETLRKMVIFATHNIFKDPPFSKLDMIVCRNLFIYLKPDSQSKILGTFYMALKNGGFLFMGSSETLGDHSNAFNILSAKHKIYIKKAGYNPGIQAELLSQSHFLTQQGNEGYRGFTRKTPKRDQITEKLFDVLLPPSVLLDEQMNIIQIINNVNPYIQIKSGKFSQNLANLISPELTVIINNIYRRLKAENDKVLFENVRLQRDDSQMKINIEGRLVQHDEDAILYLISFFRQTLPQEDTTIKEVVNLEAQYQDRLIELQNDLQFTKENLQATVEELETSNEELQASNEELIASNEELQSTNEELQSVNEELYTVNSEYQSKIDELTQLNNDINNLLNNTEVGALYLDRKLCIRKFTPSFSKISNILDFDIGRPIYHIATTQFYREFLKDIQFVQEKLQLIEKEIAHENGMLYLLRIVPYRTDYQAVDGILVTMVNITMLKTERNNLLRANARLQSALDMGNMAWWEWDIKSGQVLMHEKKATMLGYTLEEFPKNVYEICKLIHADDYNKTMNEMENHLKGISPLYDVIYRIRTKKGDYKWYYDKGGVTERDDQGKPLKVVGLVIDISTRKELEIELDKKNP
jgi:two-component system CheB/CheR fusion protein